MGLSNCVIYRLRDRLHVVSQVESDGWLLVAPPVFTVGAGDEPATIGQVVLDALRSFRQVASRPADVPEAEDPVLRAIGVPTWEAISSRHAAACSVESDGAHVTVSSNIPDENGGFSPDPSTARRCAMTPDAVGQALRAAMGMVPP